MTEERKPYTPTDGAEDIERLAQEGQEALLKQLEETADFTTLDKELDGLSLLDLPALEDAADFTALEKALEEASPLLAEELESTDFGL